MSRKNKKFSSFKVIISLVMIFVMFGNMALAASKGANSKKFYMNLLKELKEKIETTQTTTLLGAAAGRLYVESHSSFIYQSDPSKNKESNETRSLLFNDNLFLYNNGNAEYLYDSELNRMYAKDKEGKVVFCVPTSSMIGDIESLANNNNKLATTMYSMLVDSAIKNLKDEYFKDSKVNGLNEYAIIMNNNQLDEFILTIYEDLLNNEAFKEYYMNMMSLAEKDYNDSIKRDIEKIKGSLKETTNKSFELRIRIKGNNIKDIGGLDIVLCTNEDNKSELHLDGEKGKALLKSKAFELSTKNVTRYSEDGLKITGSISDKLIKADIEKYKEFKGFLSTFAEPEDDRYVDHQSIEIKTEDNKNFLNTSSVLLTIINGDDTCTIRVSSDSKESFSKATKISGKVMINNELAGEVVLSTKDNKGIAKSSDIFILATNVYGGESSISIKALDKKELSKTTNLLIITTDPYYGEETRYVLKTNDNKPFDKSKDIEIEYNNPSYIEDSFRMRVKSLDNKAFDKSTKVKVEGYINVVKFEVLLESKDKKPLIDAKLLKANIIAKSEEEHNKLNMNIVIDGRNIDMQYDSELYIMDFYEMMRSKDYKETYYISKNSAKMKFEELQKLDFDKEFNVSGAREISAKEMRDLLNIRSVLDDYLDTLENYRLKMEEEAERVYNVTI